MGMAGKGHQLDLRLLRPVPGFVRQPPPTQPCGAGVTPCGAEPARLYPCGWRCDDHAPRVEARKQPDTVAGSGEGRVAA